MFGYVKPDPDELRVKEYNTYKALYCGLCKCTGRCVSCSARFALSYDFVFLALLRIALTGDIPAFDTGRCMAHPFKKRAYALSCAPIEYSARAGALLTYYKLLDDIADTRGVRNAAYRAALPFVRSAKRHAGDLAPLGARMEVHLGALSAIEARREPSADAPAEVFGALLAEVGAFGLAEREGRIGAEVCRHVGKWIYFADALDDYASDAKSGSYNPLLYCGAADGARAAMLDAMRAERSRALDALALIDFPDGGVRAMLENILTCGMARLENKLSKTENKE